jgi:hypothetical protein
VAHSCKASCLGGWDSEDQGSRTAWANSLWDSMSKINKVKWTESVAQVVERLLCKCKALSSSTSILSPQKNKPNPGDYRNWYKHFKYSTVICSVSFALFSQCHSSMFLARHWWPSLLCPPHPLFCLMRLYLATSRCDRHFLHTVNNYWEPIMCL